MLYVHNLSYRYGPALPWVLRDIHLTLPEQGILGLIGHNGAGKSTLLSIIAGLYEIEPGDIQDNQRNTLSGKKLIDLVAIVPQDFAFYQDLSVLQNLQLFYRVAAASQKVNSLNNIIETCQLATLLKKPVRHLSGGQKRKLNLAIGLIKDTKILLLDEPTVGIDPESKQELLNVVKSLAIAGKLIVYTSHILSEVEQICDYFCILHQGAIKLTPTAFGQLENSEQIILQLKSIDDRHKLDSLVATMNKHWVNPNTLTLHNLDISYAQLLLRIEQAGVALRSSSFGSGALEQLYFSLTREER